MITSARRDIYTHQLSVTFRTLAEFYDYCVVALKKNNIN